MDEPEITHRYFRLPHQFSNFLSEPRRCDLCGVILGVYRVALFGDPEVKKGLKHICNQCLAGGALVERDLEINEGDIGALRDQLAALHPDYSPDQIEAIARAQRRGGSAHTASIDVATLLLASPLRRLLSLRARGG